MAADLPQLEQDAEHLHARARQRALGQRLAHMLAQRLHQPVIDAGLLGRHGSVEILLVLLRQSGERFALEPAHQEGPDALPQLLGALPAAIAPQERRLCPQIARQGEVKDAPQLAGVVLHGRAGERHAHLRVQLLGRHGPLALRVFDALCLVQDGEAQRDVAQAADIPP